MSKSISSSLKQLLQKYGDQLRNGSATREQLVEMAKGLSTMNRSEANRSFGDTKKGSPKKK